jgi:hypothetical protein
MQLFRSANDGLNWQKCNVPAGILSFDFVGSSDSVLFIRNRTGSNVMVYRSLDNGDTFENVHAKLPAVYTQGSGILQSIVGARDTLLTLGLDAFKMSKIYLSTNQGETFTEVNSGIPSVVGSTVMRILPGDSFFVAIVRNINDSLKYLTNGAWVGGKGQGLPEQPRLYTVDKIGKRFFALTNRGIFVTENTGYSWVFVDNPPGDGAAISKFLANTQYLFVATENNGLFRNNLNVGQAEVKLPALSVLAYPNPAYDAVRFDVPATSPVTLQLIDLQGRVVLTQTHLQPLFDVSAVARGLYIYRLITPEGTATGKLLLAR